MRTDHFKLVKLSLASLELLYHPIVLTTFEIINDRELKTSDIAFPSRWRHQPLHSHPNPHVMLLRTARSLLSRPSSTLRIIPRPQQSPRQLYRPANPITSRRRIHVSPRIYKGLQPGSEEPEPPKSLDLDLESSTQASEPAHISVEEYHEIADEYIDELVLTLEEKAETAGSGYDVEYSVRR